MKKFKKGRGAKDKKKAKKSNFTPPAERGGSVGDQADAIEYKKFRKGGGF